MESNNSLRKRIDLLLNNFANNNNINYKIIF